MSRILALFIAFVLPAPAFAASQHRLICDVNGQRGEMFAQVEVVSTTGIAQNYRGDISGVFNLQGVIVYTEGYIDLPGERLIFSGENNYADFRNVTRGGGFLVEWHVARPHLVAVIDPHGDPIPVYCREV